jgi:UDP-N-acetyl-D-mannosaminouronate:lipid I N-acetyl-D-mannosaminouronosyltransferase
MTKECVEINNVKIYPFSSANELLDSIASEKKILVAINAGKIHHATDITRNIINNNIGYIDGIGALFAARKKGFRDAVKIPGCELWLEIIRKYHQNKSFYFIGGTQDIIEKTVEKLKQEFPAINIKNYRDGYFTDEDKQLIIEDILAKKPDVIFVAMGSPKQEVLMQEFYSKYPAVYQGLGGSLDVYAGYKKRAPVWFIDHNLEGTYRVFSHFSFYMIKRHLSDMIFFMKLFFNYYK